MATRELVIIGAGIAGLTAAIYGRRAGLDVAILEQAVAGGQILITDDVENWPGVRRASGQQIADSIRDHALAFEPEFIRTEVSGIEQRGKEWAVKVEDDKEILTKTVIIATGASFRRVGCPGEARLTGMGVSYCAVCDGAFFEDEIVAVIGGGNTAVEEACYLTRFAKKVYIVHRRDQFRADRAAVDMAARNPKIVPVWDSVVSSIEGENAVEHLVLKNVKTNELSNLEVAGVFVFVGTTPNVSYIGDLVETKPGGWIATQENMSTSKPGIFAAGDVRDTGLRQLVTAAADGARAAMSAYAHIAEHH